MTTRPPTTGTADELAAALGVGPSHFYRWVRAGRIQRIGLTPPGAGRCVIVYGVVDGGLLARIEQSRKRGGKDRHEQSL